MTRKNDDDDSDSSESEADEDVGSNDGSGGKKSKKEKKKKKKSEKHLDETSEERRERKRLKKEKKEKRMDETSEERRERKRLKKEKKEKKAEKKEKKESKRSKRDSGASFDEESEQLIDGGSGHEQRDSMIQIKERPKWEVWVRRILCMPANPELETPIKRYIRYLSWATLAFDMTAAIVSLVTFGGITICCDEPILNMAGDNVNWAALIQSVIVIYLVLLCMEIYPVVSQGFPFNIVNPVIGFFITFAVFFDDAKTEALIMWGLETMAVFCEFAVYRLKIFQCRKRAVEIKELMPHTTRKVGETFEDEEAAAHDLRTARRKFYVLRKEQAKDEKLLRWLVFAIYLNFVLTSLVLILILVIARSGGLCFQNFQWPNPFYTDQIGLCFMCSEPDVLCEVCTEETQQCYFPYQ